MKKNKKDTKKDSKTVISILKEKNFQLEKENYVLRGLIKDLLIKNAIKG